jgi:Spy/CpxP family protein refolding chaperone
MRAVRGLLAAVLAAGIVTVVAAQPGGGFGFGGGTQDTFVIVLNNKALQEEVKVTDEQKTKFKSITEKQTELTKKATEGMKEKFTDAKGDKDKMTELFTAMRKETEKVTAEVKKLVEAELTADQKKRLKQIYVQALGVNAFTNEDVLKDLGATDAQKGTLKTLTTDFTKDVAEVRKDIFGEPKGKGGFTKQDPEKTKEFNTKRDKLTKETMGKVTEALTDDQKKKWTEMTGEPFDLAKLRTGFGPGGGGFGKDKAKTKKDDE